MSAPGRVNLIGEHTDYNGGFVLPAAIPQRTGVELARRPDRLIEVWSANMGPAGEMRTYALGEEAPDGTWIDYVKGITLILSARGLPVSGASMRIESAVPEGSGLSSSAALEVSVLRGLRQAFGLELDDVQLAALGQQAENEFVGAPVGIMDQMAAALADETHALFLDTRSLVFERVALPADAELVVINSGIAHRHAGGDYRTRRAECERAAAALGVPQLRDAGAGDLPRVNGLTPPLDRRARHVITENERVLAAVRALRDGDLRRLGALFRESHQSMRDDYDVSIPEINLLVRLADAHEAVYGARLTGGGFGGSIVALARSGSGRAIAEAVVRDYERQTGRKGTVLVPMTPPTPVSSA